MSDPSNSSQLLFYLSDFERKSKERMSERVNSPPWHQANLVFRDLFNGTLVSGARREPCSRVGPGEQDLSLVADCNTGEAIIVYNVSHASVIKIDKSKHIWFGTKSESCIVNILMRRHGCYTIYK